MPFPAPSLHPFFPLAEGFAALLAPYAEVVIHDLAHSQIAAIYNAFSKRQVGDVSHLEDLHADLEAYIHHEKPDHWLPYPKTNWDGRPLRSTSILLRDADDHPCGLLCINLDTSILETAYQQLGQFLQHMPLPSSKHPENDTTILFQNDWHEQINTFIGQTLQQSGKQLAQMTRSEKATLVKQLNAQGAFHGRHAADYIARLLNVSRATVYNYLK